MLLFTIARAWICHWPHSQAPGTATEASGLSEASKVTVKVDPVPAECSVDGFSLDSEAGSYLRCYRMDFYSLVPSLSATQIFIAYSMKNVSDKNLRRGKAGYEDSRSK